MSLSDKLNSLKNLPPPGEGRTRVARHPFAGKSKGTPPTDIKPIMPDEIALFGNSPGITPFGAPPPAPFVLKKTNPPTHEQEAIIASKDFLLKINAYAGTGKTSTLEMIALANPGESFLYIAFNQSVKTEASKRFPANVRCYTSHGLAFKSVGSQYQNTGKLKPNLRLTDIVDFLGIRKSKNAWLEASLIQKTILNYIADSAVEMSSAHLPIDDLRLLSASQKGRSVSPDMIFRQSLVVWNGMCDLGNLNMPMIPDGYLKLYCNLNPELPHDILLLDEAQDTAPSFLKFFLGQNSRRVLVGDDAQAIYSFRGAVNAMALTSNAKELNLTKSWRFGDDVAIAANSVLFQKGKTLPLVGNSDIKSSILRSAPPLGAAYTYIARSNASLFDKAVTLASQGKKLHFVGGPPHMDKKLILDILELYNKKSPANPLLQAFQSYDEFRSAVDLMADTENIARCNLVEEYGNRLPNILDRVLGAHNENQSQCDVILSTTHKAKGLEYDTVVLADDFAFMSEPRDTLSLIDPKHDEEANILYVAMTRAKRSLHMGDQIFNMVSKFRKGIDGLHSARALLAQGYTSDLVSRLEGFRIGGSIPPFSQSDSSKRRI